MIWTASQVATIAIARVQSKFSMSITSCTTHRRFIQGSLRARPCPPKSNYDFFAPTTTNTIPPTSANPPKRGESGMVFWVSAVAWKGSLLIGLFLVYCYFAISVQGLMFGVPCIYYVYILRIVVLGNFSRTEPARMQNSRDQAASFSFGRGSLR